ncbi:MAG: FkbM family methyltransferase [archaeon]
MVKRQFKDNGLREKVFRASYLASKLFPESRLKERSRLFFYKYIYSAPVGKKEFSLDNIKFSIVKTLFSIDNKSIVKTYLKFYKPKKGDVVLDVGSFYGVYAIYCSKAVGPTGKVLAFDIDPVNLKILKQNFALNRNKNLVLIEKGLWDRNTTGSISIGGTGSSVMKKHSFTKIKLVKGDDLLKNMKLKRLDCIKMNIEGAEIEAFKGLRKTIDRFSPKLIIMADHVVNGEQTYKKLLPMIKAMGYETTMTGNKIIVGTRKRD